jgi:NhaP-type Na+/H+ and K+/H+ antiporter
MPNNEDHKFDLYYMSAIVPKGLAAAVLATIPLQRGIVGGEFIMNLTFSIVLFSIVFTSVLVPLVGNNASVRRMYEVGLNFSMLFRVLVQKYQKARKEKKLKKEAFEKEPLQSDYDTVISELNANKEKGEIKK